jgi:hypothetical protein
VHSQVPRAKVQASSKAGPAPRSSPLPTTVMSTASPDCPHHLRLSGLQTAQLTPSVAALKGEWLIPLKCEQAVLFMICDLE